MVAVSLAVWAVLLPAVLLIVRTPSRPARAVPDRIEPANGLDFAGALRAPAFWILSLIAALIFYAIFVVSQQLNLYLQSPRIGFTAEAAANAQSLIFALSIAGKFLYGFLADYLPTRRVMLISGVTLLLSTLVFLHFDGTTVYLFVFLFGLNYGGTFVLLQLLVADLFGLRDYAKILGALTVIETIGGASGTYVTGRIADAYGGDYYLAFLCLIAVAAASLALIVTLNIRAPIANK